MSLIIALLSLLIPLHSIGSRLSVTLTLCGPFFILGSQGLNGEPVIVFIRNMITWKKKCTVMLYNGTARPLAAPMIENYEGQPSASDKLVDYLNAAKHLFESKKENNSELIEGVNFQFAEDQDLNGFYLDQEEQPESEPEQSEVSLHGCENEIISTKNSDNLSAPIPANIVIDVGNGFSGLLENTQEQKNKSIETSSDKKTMLNISVDASGLIVKNQSEL